ncbi:MAG TPA: EAL domain-containing protein [Actinomycetota bacterium]|nr:EAL domain-containing protein [Actinomycetota bacterium]
MATTDGELTGLVGASALDALLGASSLLEATPESLVVAAADGRIVYANRRVEELSGFTRSELLDRAVDVLVAADRPIREDTVGSRIGGSCHRKVGEDVPVEIHLGAVEGAAGRYLVVTLRDVSDLRRGEAARFEAEAKYASLVEGIPAITYIDPIDENQSSIYVSPQVTELLGLSPEEWLTDPYCWRRHVHPEDEQRAWDEYVEACRNEESLTHEYRMVHEDGRVLWVSEQAFIIRNERGEPWLIQGVIFDITERKRAEEQVAFLAYHDKLTGLPNRALFEEMLELALARARRHDLGVGVLFLDLDNFKLVNDSMGHHAGDELLVELAERLRGCTRETDLVARQGGDEFLLLLSDLDRGSSANANKDAGVLVAESVAERVREALRAPFVLEGTEFYASGSIGISLYPQDALDAQSLLRNADTAMYESKRTDPGGFVVFSSSDQDPRARLSLTTRLRKAVQQRHWVLHYQPIVDLSDGHLHSVEALIRWQEPNGGLVAPGEFIPLAEELGLIEAIGEWVLDELIRQHLEWRQAGLEVAIGYNLSPRQLWSARLADRVLAKLQTAGVDPHAITMEITESTAMTDPERTQRILSELHAWGLPLAIDDFGTGYSSLARLKHMPVDVLKIDRSFVRDVDRDRDLAGMVRAIIQLAQSLGMVPLAEGIETPSEYVFLRSNGCRLAQGFLFSRPVPAAEIPELARREGGLAPRLFSRS